MQVQCYNDIHNIVYFFFSYRTCQLHIRVVQFKEEDKKDKDKDKDKFVYIAPQRILFFFFMSMFMRSIKPLSISFIPHGY